MINSLNNTPTKEETKKEISFATIEAMLKHNGYTVSETTPTAAQMIGATDGKKYHTDKGVIEVYQFDKLISEPKKMALLH